MRSSVDCAARGRGRAAAGGGEHYLAAEDLESTLEAVERALTRRDELDTMALAARRAAEQLDWDVVGRKFMRVVMAAVVRRRR